MKAIGIESMDWDSGHTGRSHAMGAAPQAQACFLEGDPGLSWREESAKQNAAEPPGRSYQP